MDIILFYYFSMLAKFRNYSVTAEEVYLSQSSLSKRIKSLEDKLGVELFIRNPRSLELTEAGKALLPFAQNISKETEILKQDMNRLKYTDSVLRISATSFLSYYGIMNHITSYINENPDINIGIKEINSEYGMEQLSNDKIDAVIMFNTLPSDKRYNIYPLAKDEMMGIMNRKHELAERPDLTLKELCTQELIVISEHDEPFFKKFLWDELGNAGFHLRIRSYRVWIGAIESILKQSQSVAVLPKRVAERMNHENIIYKKIKGLPEISFSILIKANNNKAVLTDFIKHLNNGK